MKLNIIVSYIPLLLNGLEITVELSVGALLLATAIGMVVGLMRSLGVRWLYFLTVPYVEGLRAVPPLVVLFFAYYAIPILFGIDVPSFAAAVLALGVAGGAYMAEIVRGGVQAVNRGQWEAGYSLGMPYARVVSTVILPQAIRVAVPPAISLYVALIKDSSLVSAIGVVDLTAAGMNVRGVLFGQGTIIVFLLMGVFYFAICYSVSQMGLWLERRSHV